MSWFKRNKETFVEEGNVNMLDDDFEEIKQRNTIDIRDKITKEEEQEQKEYYRKTMLRKITHILLFVTLALNLLNGIIRFDLGALIVLVLATFSLVMVSKNNKSYEYGVIDNYYAWNLTTTLDTAIRNTIILDFFAQRRKLFAQIGLIVVVTEQLFLRSLLPYALSSALAAIGYLLLLITLINYLSVRNTHAMAQILFIFAIGIQISLTLTYFIFGYLNGLNLIFVITAYLVGERMQKINIDYVNKDELEQAFFLLNHSIQEE